MLTYEQIEPHLHKWADKLQNRSFDKWELISATWLSGKPQRVKHIQYASNAVKWAMIDYMRRVSRLRNKRKKNVEATPFSILNGESEDGLQELRFSAQIKAKPPRAMKGLIQKDLFEALTKGFTHTEKLIIKMRYLGGYNMREIAEVQGSTQSNISIIHKKLLKRIRERIERSKD